MEPVRAITRDAKPTGITASPNSRGYQAWIVVELGKLAATIGEPMDAEGNRLRLMAQDLCDLSQESLQHALTVWRKGDKRHLTEAQQETSRLGVFFPRPVELREIANWYSAAKWRAAHAREELEKLQAAERHRLEHPEDYVSVASVFESVLKK